MASNAAAALTALGNGSQGAGISAFGNYAGGLSSLFGAASARNLAAAEADASRYAGAQAAKIVRRDTRNAVGAARAATAGSGVALDQFSTPAVSDIQFRGANDEAMAILTGDTRALQARTRGTFEGLAGVQSAAGSVLRGASFSGWKGAKSATPPWYDGTTGDSSGGDATWP